MAVNTKVVISGDSSGAVLAVNRLKTELTGLQSIAAKSLGNFGGLLTGGAAVTGLVAITKRAIDAGDALYKMSQKTGLAVEDLGKLQYAADLSGVSSEALQKGMTSLATGMIEASIGSGTAGEAIKKLGISVKNADGSMRSSMEVLYDLADVFSLMPDGAEKTTLAVDIFGKKLGAEMIPMLNGGSAGLKSMGDEAERLGIIMSTEMAKKSEEFNDNLARLGKLSESAGISVAGSLIPALNDLLRTYLAAQASGLGMWDALAAASRSGSVEENIARVTATLVRLKKQQDDINSGKLRVFGTDTSEEIAKQEKLLAMYRAQQDSSNQDAAMNAAKRILIEKQMQAKLAEIAKLRGVAEGKISADILLDDTKRTDAQIKNAEKLRDTLTGMWSDSLKAAAAAGEEAKKLFEQAADLRTSGADKAAAKRRSTLSPEDQQAEILKQYGELSQSASQSASLAQIAAFNGRTENSAKLARQAAKDAERAAKLADQIDDPELAARAIEEVTDIQARLLEAQAKAKQKEQADFEAQAAAQRELIAVLDKQLTDLQTKAASLKVEVDISSAQAALVQLQAQLDNLNAKIASSGITGDVPMQEGGGYAAGGYTGPGGKYQPAGIVHAGEFVLRQEVVRQRGALEFLSRFNRMGLSALKGYASGGLVSAVRLPSLASSSAASAQSPVIINLPDGGSFPLKGSSEVIGQMKTAFQRAALKRGGRK